MVRRRGVLLAGFGLLAGLAAMTGLTGCTEQTPAAPTPPTADGLSLVRAIAAARALRAAALAIAAAEPARGTLLKRVAAVHEAHLVALGAPAEEQPSPSATGTATPTDQPTDQPTDRPTTVSQLAQAEWTAARTALRDGQAAAPAFAVLFSRIAAARAADTDLLAAAIGAPAPGDLTRAPAPGGAISATPTGPASVGGGPAGLATTASAGTPTPAASPARPDTPALKALDRLLAGQHAAVFAYPLIVARTTGARQRRARDLWAAHREERDEIEVRLLEDGAQPVAADAAYDVGSPPATPDQAAALAAKVEQGLSALAVDVVAAATDSVRRVGADQLVLAARRAAAWTGRPATLLPVAPPVAPPATTGPSPAAG